MQIREIELHHPHVNDGIVARMVVRMSRIHCSPPDHLGRRRMGAISIVVPRKSEEQRLLLEFRKATSGREPYGITPLRLVAGDHVGGWSIDGGGRAIEGEDERFTLFFSKDIA